MNSLISHLETKLEQPIARTILAHLLPEWLGSIEGSENTRTTYKKGVTHFMTWLEHNRQQIDGGTVRLWRDTYRDDYSAGTINVWLSGVRSFFDWLFEQGHIPHNPAAAVKGAKRRGTNKKHKRDELTSAEIRRVLALIDIDIPDGARDYAIISLMAYCALRTVEVHRATIEDIQTRNGRTILWIQGKGAAEKDDFVVLPSIAEDALNQWLTVHPFTHQKSLCERPLFCSLSNRSYGQPLSTSYMRRTVKNAYYNAGISSKRKTTHSLRHSAISTAIRNGGDLFQVQAMARHSDPKTTMVYYHEIGRTENPAEDLISY